MNEIKVSEFGQLHEALNKYSSEMDHCFFRGQSDASWPLIPKAGRHPFDTIEDDELFQDWMDGGRQYLTDSPRTKLESLAIAQHHGLATRLLDWSLNPFVAAFFAVWEDNDTDAAIYVITEPYSCRCGTDSDPFYLEERECYDVMSWEPSAVTLRLVRQSGVFTVHDPPTKVMSEFFGKELDCIIIKRQYRKKLKKELAYYGYTRSSLFPDLDGVAGHLNWKVEDGIYKPRR